MNWLKIAGVFLKKAIRRVDLAIVLLYVFDIAEFIIGITKTLKDNFVWDCIKGLINVYKNRSQMDTIYELAAKMSTVIALVAGQYQEFEHEKNAIQGISLMRQAADKMRQAK